MEKIKRIVFCAERPDKGPTGGAAGVMYLLRQYLDVEKCNCSVEYMYRRTSRKQFVCDLVKESILRNNTYYICHEPDSASILSILNKKYSLVYHQQGPIVQEYLSQESNPKKIKIKKKELIEKLAFTGADTVFFPSKGASDEYFNSKYSKNKRERINVGSPLYNTINIDEEVPIDDVRIDNSFTTFLSVGTMSELKGQDLSYKFIASFVKKSKKRVRWITVGDGVIKDRINVLCKSLEEETNNKFIYIHYDCISHGSVLYLDRISDIYIMMHRSSIFDLATLEAMRSGCAVVLSNIGGNRDFNINDNVILTDSSDFDTAVEKLIESDIVLLKVKNKNAFDRFFSPERFSDRYVQVINSITDRD